MVCSSQSSKAHPRVVIMINPSNVCQRACLVHSFSSVALDGDGSTIKH